MCLVFVVCCVCSSLFEELITHSEESYQVCVCVCVCVCVYLFVCGVETSKGRPMPTLSFSATGKKVHFVFVCTYTDYFCLLDCLLCNRQHFHSRVYNIVAS